MCLYLKKTYLHQLSGIVQALVRLGLDGVVLKLPPFFYISVDIFTHTLNFIFIVFVGLELNQ